MGTRTQFVRTNDSYLLVMELILGTPNVKKAHVETIPILTAIEHDAIAHEAMGLLPIAIAKHLRDKVERRGVFNGPVRFFLNYFGNQLKSPLYEVVLHNGHMHHFSDGVVRDMHNLVDREIIWIVSVQKRHEMVAKGFHARSRGQHHRRGHGRDHRQGDGLVKVRQLYCACHVALHFTSSDTFSYLP